MSDDKGKKAQDNLQRIPAEKLLLDFIKDNNLVMFVDEVGAFQPVIKGSLYVLSKSSRIRIVYQDQIKTEDATNGEQKSDVKIVN